MATLLGQFDEPLGYAVKVCLLTALYGAILTPIFYPLLRRMLEGSRPNESGAVLGMEKSSSRLKVLALLVAVMFAALGTRLWFLQVLATEQFQVEADNNRTRIVETDALRGDIRTADHKTAGDEPRSASRCAWTCRPSRRAAARTPS